MQCGSAKKRIRHGRQACLRSGAHMRMQQHNPRCLPNICDRVTALRRALVALFLFVALAFGPASLQGPARAGDLAPIQHELTDGALISICAILDRVATAPDSDGPAGWTLGLASGPYAASRLWRNAGIPAARSSAAPTHRFDAPPRAPPSFLHVASPGREALCASGCQVLTRKERCDDPIRGTDRG